MPEHSAIDGDLFADALRSGIHRVLGQQELLNRINVFPVADSDTGTNLSLSLGSALAVLHSKQRRDESRHLGTLLAAVADALLDGARGNSGAIMAQFFQGMSDSAGEIGEWTIASFAAAARRGSQYAHDALSKPREGTILSVIAAFADSVEQQAKAVSDASFGDLLSQAQDRVDQALAETPRQLDVLRRAGVVDAGAKGFAELVTGMAGFFVTGKVDPMPDIALPAIPEPAPALSAVGEESRFRFCTECVISGAEIDRRKLREELGALGDSLVLAGSKRKAKIHLHVDDPDAVFRIAARFGELTGQKADDMHRQQNASHSTAQRFAVITDSAADLADRDMERLDIHMVPCRIQFGDRGYLDKVSITTEEFYKELATNPNHPTTSQPAPGDFRRQYQFLASHFPDVLSINLTSAASGTYQSALFAAGRMRASGSVHVVDSRNASVGQGQLVVLAAECARAGLGIDDTLQLLEDRIAKVRIFALLRDLHYAERGGRLPGWVRMVASLFRLAPIVTLGRSGKVGLAGFLFGRRNRVRKFTRFVAARLPRDETIDLAVGHALVPDDAAAASRQLQDTMGKIGRLDICALGTALGVHGGPGTLIISAHPRVSLDDIGNLHRR